MKVLNGTKIDPKLSMGSLKLIDQFSIIQNPSDISNSINKKLLSCTLYWKEDILTGL